MDEAGQTILDLGETRTWNDYVGIPVPMSVQIDATLVDGEQLLGF